MNKFAIYGLNILFIAVPLAIIEIVFEKTQGWGSGFDKSKWYAKQFAPNSGAVKAIVRTLNIEVPLNYHAFVFMLIIPALMVVEYLFWTRNILLLVSIYAGVLVFEDFLWFLFNWHFDSLNQLTKGPHGSIWWHKRWIKLSHNRYLPASYPTSLIFTLVLLLLA